MCDDLQSFLSKQQHQKVDKIRGNDLKEEDEEIVYKFAATYIAVRVPDLPFERIFVKNAPAPLQYLAPRDLLYTALRYIDHRYTFPSAKKQDKKT